MIHIPLLYHGLADAFGDPRQGCCSAAVDACGVCNGGDASCALRAIIRVAAREDLEIEMLIGRMKSELGALLASYMITPDHITVDVRGMEQVSRRRLLGQTATGDWATVPESDVMPARRSNLEEGWVEVDIPFVVYPPDYTSNLEQPLVSEAAEFLSQLTPSQLRAEPDGMKIVNAVQVDVTGVCGNHICEFGEMDLPGGEAGSCPQDCPDVAQSNITSADQQSASTSQVCPDIMQACAGNDAEACYEATVAATSAECMAAGMDDTVEVPPLNADLIAPCPLDVNGTCCPSPATLDAERACCRDMFGVDECGVCGGRGSSCAKRVLVQVVALQTLEVQEFVANMQQSVAALMDSNVTAEDVRVDVESMKRLPSDSNCNMLDGMVVPSGVQASRTPGNGSAPRANPACKYGEEYLRLQFPLEILPPAANSGLRPPEMQQVCSLSDLHCPLFWQCSLCITASPTACMAPRDQSLTRFLSRPVRTRSRRRWPEPSALGKT